MEFILFTIVATLLLVAILIGIHEYGHFITAKYLGVKVLRFSIGFGKTIYRYIGSDKVEYCLSAIPLGGYVKLLDTREGDVNTEELSQAFDTQLPWKRALIIVAGPLFNFIFALVSLWIIFLIGYKSLIPIIPSIQENSALAKAGVQPGAEILEVDGYQTLDWAEVTVRLFKRLGDNVDFPMLVKSNNKLQTITLNMAKVELDELSPNPILGIGVIIPKNKVQTLPERIQQYPPLTALGAAINKIGMYSYFSLLVIKKLFTRKLSINSLSGPLGLFAYAGVALMDSIMTFLLYMAIISIIIAVVNILPFPGLDGGQMMYIGYEWITGHSVSVALQVLLFRFGLILLGILMVQILVNDLLRFTS